MKKKIVFSFLLVFSMIFAFDLKSNAAETNSLNEIDFQVKSNTEHFMFAKYDDIIDDGYIVYTFNFNFKFDYSKEIGYFFNLFDLNYDSDYEMAFYLSGTATEETTFFDVGNISSGDLNSFECGDQYCDLHKIDISFVNFDYKKMSCYFYLNDFQLMNDRYYNLVLFVRTDETYIDFFDPIEFTDRLLAEKYEASYFVLEKINYMDYFERNKNFEDELINENTGLKDQVTKLINDKDTLTNENAVLQSQVNNLTNDKTALLGENAELQDQVANLNNDKLSLLDENTTIKKENSSLKNQVNDLESDLKEKDKKSFFEENKIAIIASSVSGLVLVIAVAIAIVYFKRKND